jgi:hypothetical protein
MEIEHSSLEYLFASSKNSLEGLELARLNQIANFRKEFSQLFDAWFTAEIEARLARVVLEARRSRDSVYPVHEFVAPARPSLPALSPTLEPCGWLPFPREDSSDCLPASTFAQSDDPVAPELVRSEIQAQPTTLVRSRTSAPHRFRNPINAATALLSLEQIAYSTERSLRRNPFFLADLHSQQQSILFSVFLSQESPRILRPSTRSTVATASFTQVPGAERHSSARVAKGRRFRAPNFAPKPASSHICERRAGLIDRQSFATRSARNRMHAPAPIHASPQRCSYLRIGSLP